MIDWVTPPRSHSRASFTLRTGSQWNKCCSTTLQHRWRGGSDGNGSTGVANLAVTGQRRPATTKTLAAADQRRRTVAPGLDVDVAAPRRKYTAHHASQSRSRPLASVRVAEIIRYPSLDNLGSSLHQQRTDESFPSARVESIERILGRRCRFYADVGPDATTE